MKEENAKLTHIVEELTHYFLKLHALDVTSHIKILDDYTEIEVHAKDLTLTPMKLKDIRAKFNSPRQKEVEGYYWELVGGEHEEPELGLVSTMVDLIEIDTSEDNGTIIKMRRQR